MRPRKPPVGWLALACAVLLIAIFHSAILSAMGRFLVNAGPPEKADVALVLAGDFRGNRILQAAELIRQGYAPKLLVSGPSGLYGFYECDLAIPFAEKHGYPESYFVREPHEAPSTVEEAQALLPKIREMGAKTVLLVTSDYHTRRSAKIFRAQAPDLTFYVVAASDPFFTTNGWWHNREGRKTFAFEWMKTIAEWLRL